MKYLLTIIAILFGTCVQAEIYKCKIKGKVSYQETPCELSGGVGKQIKKAIDISPEQQLAAQARLEVKLAKDKQQKKEKKQEYSKERAILAEEDKAKAAYQAAEHAKRQAIALEERNEIERKKSPGVLYYRY